MSPAATALTGRDQPCPEPRRPAPGLLRCTRFLDLSSMLTAPKCARAWTREILREWQLDDLADSAESIATELAANAVVHDPAGPGQSVIRLGLAFDQGALVILVGDSSPDRPVVTHPDTGAEHGRGMMMVEIISDAWGVLPLDGTAKVVWAALAAEPAAAASEHAAPAATAAEMMARPLPATLPSAGAQEPGCPGKREDSPASVSAGTSQAARP